MPEKSLCWIFRNIGLNTKCVGCYFAFYQKLPQQLLHLVRTKNPQAFEFTEVDSYL